jgi:hypothetical protein
MRTPSDRNAPGGESPDASGAQSHFRWTLIRVMTVQVAALLFLWWLQSRYAG